VGDQRLGVQAWSALLRAHAAVVQRIGAELERQTGMPLSWYDVLLELNAAEGRRLRMNDLGERVVLSRSRVSRVVDELEEAGYVSRQRHHDDGRVTFATLSEAGRAAFRRAAPRYLDLIGSMFAAHLDVRTLRTIRDGLQRVIDAHGRG
jgi:DNA-binding MarR family transcriptional regulator